MKMKKVAIVIGAASDWEYAKSAAVVLRKFNVPFSANIISAYRTPARLLEFSGRAIQDEIGVVIAVSGPTAHLSAAIAASTLLPVIAVPVRTGSKNEAEACFTYAQTPTGVPVATVGFESCENAAILAIQILAIGDPDMTNRLSIYKQTMTDALVEADFMLQREISEI